MPIGIATSFVASVSVNFNVLEDFSTFPDSLWTHRSSTTPSNLYCRRSYQLFLTKTEASTKFLKIKDSTGLCRKSNLFLLILLYLIVIGLNDFILYLLKSSTIIGNYCRRVGLIPPLPRTSSPLPSERNDENCYRNLLFSKRQLFLKMHNLASRLRRVTPDKIWDLATQFREVKILFTDFKTRVNSDSKTKAELLEEVDARLECCHKLYEKLMRDGLGGDTEIRNSDVKLSAEDSTSQSQLTKCSSKLSTLFVKNLQRRIELKRQRAEISATRKRDLAKAKAAAEAADAKARFRFEEARLEAEEKLLELSMSGLSISNSRAHHSNYRDTTESKSVARRDYFNVKKFWSRGREEAVAVRIPRSQQVTLNAAAASSNSVFKKIFGTSKAKRIY